MIWPDWSGETVVIVGTGPSATGAALIEAKGKSRCIVIKRSWLLAPWADVLYGIDKGWWIANHGCPEFTGLKITPSPTAARVYRLQQVRLRPRAEILTKETGTIGCGLDSGGGFAGFQAMNLAVQFGAIRLVLVGFDMTIRGGAHWHQDYMGVGKPDVARTERWRRALDGCAGQFHRRGVEVLNASAGSALQVYPKVEFSSLWPSRPALTLSSAT